MIVPLLPFWVDQVEANVSWVGAILSAQGLGVCAGSILLGMLSDRWGRKKTLVATLVGDILFFFLTAICVTPSQLLVVRMFAGFSTPISPSYAWMLNEVSSEERTAAIGRWTAYLLGGYTLGTMAGSFIGGNLGWFWAGATTSILVAVVTVPILFSVEKERVTETMLLIENDKIFSPPAQVPLGSIFRMGSSKTLLHEGDSPSEADPSNGYHGKSSNIDHITLDKISETSSYENTSLLVATEKVSVMISPEYIVLCIVQFFYGCTMMANMAFVSIILKDEFLYSETFSGLYFTLLAATLLFVTIFAFKAMVDYVGPYRLVALGCPVLAGLFSLAGCCVFLPAFRSQWAYMAVTLMFTIVFVFTNPTLTLIASNMAQKFEPEKVGAIVGILRASFNMGQAVGPLVGVEFLESGVFSPVYGFLVFGVSLLVAWILTIMIRLSRGLSGFAVNR
eukprot:gb/GEZN01006231.1/.p1 GENE.gb/GEZN01006231.1/~~gb/GEZN01006231.1/.p1  ORF type:complete len:508 (-),score=28.21 gb/GEZN01006231.1/:170-1519(-)